MNDRYSARDYAMTAWVVCSAVVTYTLLGYAVFQSHGDDLRSIVNHLLGGGV